MTFEEELRHLLNKYSKESASATPDFILAKYLYQVLEAYNEAVHDRQDWYGHPIKVGELNG